MSSCKDNEIWIYYPRKEKYLLQSINYTLDENHPGVAIATLNTPSNLNALSLNLMQELFLVLEHAKRDNDVEAIVWTGSGERSFCSGCVIIATFFVLSNLF